MIKCPKCGESERLIREQPIWADVGTEQRISVNSYCLKCKTDFWTVHKLNKAIEIRDIRENVEYPF